MNYERIVLDPGTRGVATLTLNRPDRGNAYDDVMLRELMIALAELDNDDAVRVVLLRGAGKHFCVGADIAWHRANQGDPSAREAGPKLIDMLLALDRLSKPAIAVLHGAAVGGGLALPLCCDVAFATTDALFSIPEVRIGLMPGPLVPLFLRAMSYRDFRRYGLSGGRFSSAEARAMGLIHDAAPAEQIEAMVAKQVEEFLLSAPGAIAGLKALAAELAPPPITPAMLEALEEMGRGMLETEEAKEGVASFLEKRKPRWYPSS
ncbi:MAG TPA: enoyl-CoA hydratase-related protein [Stellaceae bacterium]|jgi:methylglutaconyl-CoA hydratase|nr:enoyl-CoA hydratase-related protein [Stellaceae bacterium]